MAIAGRKSALIHEHEALLRGQFLTRLFGRLGAVGIALLAIPVRNIPAGWEVVLLVGTMFSVLCFVHDELIRLRLEVVTNILGDIDRSEGNVSIDDMIINREGMYSRNPEGQSSHSIYVRLLMKYNSVLYRMEPVGWLVVIVLAIALSRSALHQ